MRLRVLYAGLAGSGRSTSLARLVPRLAGETDPAWRLRLREARITLAERTVDVELGAAVFGNLWFPSLRDATASDIPRVRHAATHVLAMLPALDGVVFVVDSERTIEANRGNLDELLEELARANVDIAQVPFTFQVNRRDTPVALDLGDVRAALATPRAAYVESIASHGYGVARALDTLIAMIEHRDVEPLAIAPRASPRAPETLFQPATRAVTVDGVCRERFDIHRIDTRLALADQLAIARGWPKRGEDVLHIAHAPFAIDVVERTVTLHGRDRTLEIDRRAIAVRLHCDADIVYRTRWFSVWYCMTTLVLAGSPARVRAAEQDAIANELYVEAGRRGVVVDADLAVIAIGGELHAWWGSEPTGPISEVILCGDAAMAALGQGAQAPGASR